MRIKDLLLCIEYWNPNEVYLHREVIHLQEFLKECAEGEMQGAYISSIFMPKRYEDVLEWMEIEKTGEGLKIKSALTDEAAVGIAWLYLKRSDIKDYLRWLIGQGYESACRAVTATFKLENNTHTLMA